MKIKPTQERVEDLAREALRRAIQRCKPATVENKRNCWEVKIVPALRDRTAADVTHDEAQAAAEAWGVEYGPHAALKAAREAGHGWRLAMQRGWLLRTPWHGVHVPGAVRGEQRVMPRGDRETLRAYLEPVALRGVRSRFKRVTALATLFLAEVPTGRVAETAALERTGVDLHHRVVTWYRHKTDRGGPKYSALTDYGARILSTALIVLPDSPWVFPGPGRSGHVCDLTKSMAKVCRHLGMKPYTPHDLRRGIAQEARDAGASLEDIQAMLGHESRATTERYLGWSPVQASRALELVTLGGGR